MAPSIIGIDLGTTNSCAAICNESGDVTLIPYRGGEFTIPSVFAIDDKGNELLGADALRQWQLNPKNTVFGAKRLIGVAWGTELVAEMRTRVGYGLEQGTEDSVQIPIAGKNFSLTDISAKILGKIVEVASDYLGERVEKAVVTVPAYFTDRQRQAVRVAGEKTELEILHIINEPTAAALAYGGRQLSNTTVAVYDLGGGTFDMSIIEIRGRVFEVKATGGDIFLGGIDFDEALIQYILSDFTAKHDVDLTSDPIAMQRIRDMAERVKVDLSSRQEAPISIPFITMTGGQPLDLNVIVRREDLEALVSHLAERTFDTVAKVIDDAGLDLNSIDEILLVGGQTRMPMIQERITEFFGKAPSKAVHPDEAVAIGAALYAWSLDEKSDLKYQLLDVLAMAIGIETAEGKLHHLFKRNESVPNQRQFTFTTHKDNQKDLIMKLFQGDQEATNENAALGEFTFSGLRQSTAGSVRVEVVFNVSSEGILSLEARDLDTGNQMQQTVRFGT